MVGISMKTVPRLVPLGGTVRVCVTLPLYGIVSVTYFRGALIMTIPGPVSLGYSVEVTVVLPVQGIVTVVNTGRSP